MAIPPDLQVMQDVADTYLERRARFPDEDERQALLVVLYNFGDRYTRLSCVAGEWHGTKADLPARPGIPRCPGNHVLLEHPRPRYRLGIVEEQSP